MTPPGAPGPGAANLPPATGISPLEAMKFGFKEMTSPFSNVLLPALCNIIPLVGPLALLGWHAEIHNRLMHGHRKPVPKFDFSDFGDYIGRGVPYFVVGLVTSLPLVPLLYILIFAIIIFLGILMVILRGIPVIILWPFVFLAVWLPLVSIYGTITSGMTIRAEVSGDIGEGFSFGKAFGLVGKVFGALIVANLLFFVMAVPMLIAGYICFIVGVYVAAAILGVAGAHLRFQAHRLYLARGGEPIPMKPLMPLKSEQGPMMGGGQMPGGYVPPPGGPGTPPPGGAPPPGGGPGGHQFPGGPPPGGPYGGQQ